MCLYPLFPKKKKKTFPWCILISQTPCLLFYSPLHPSLSLFFSSVQGLPGLVCYHACMHHGPANKLHRVATPLPLSLSCQVEPLKRPSSTPLHSHPSIYLTGLLLCWHILAPAYTLDLPPIPSTCAAISAAGGLGLVSLWHSHHPSIHFYLTTHSFYSHRSPNLLLVFTISAVIFNIAHLNRRTFIGKVCGLILWKYVAGSHGNAERKNVQLRSEYNCPPNVNIKTNILCKSID